MVGNRSERPASPPVPPVRPPPYRLPARFHAKHGSLRAFRRRSSGSTPKSTRVPLGNPALNGKRYGARKVFTEIRFFPVPGPRRTMFQDSFLKEQTLKKIIFTKQRGK